MTSGADEGADTRLPYALIPIKNRRARWGFERGGAAEGAGFEPAVSLQGPTGDFESPAFVHSATPPP